jgi:REP element-mobilizing transposase RayT
MNYDPNVHHRRSIRLPEYDYSQAGAYFVTICTHDRALLLNAESVQEVVNSTWHSLLSRFPTIALDEFIIMPNHVHGIIFLDDPGLGTASSAPTLSAAKSPFRVASAAFTVDLHDAPTLGQVVRALKSRSAIEANKVLNRSGQFWQRNYYEHIIRDDDEPAVIRQYIRDNPINWDEDPDNPIKSRRAVACRAPTE